jgi:hypothetical protein
VGELADLTAGTFYGSVVSDASGSGQSDVTVTVTKIGPRRVRVSSDYPRLATVEVDVTRFAHSIGSARGPSTFHLEMDTQPWRLEFSPDGSVSYDGRRR